MPFEINEKILTAIIETSIAEMCTNGQFEFYCIILTPCTLAFEALIGTRFHKVQMHKYNFYSLSTSTNIYY